MNNETIPKVDVDVVYEEESPVIYQKKDNIAFLTLNRTKYHNSQNSQMLYSLDDAFLTATSDDGVKVIEHHPT